MDRDAGVVLVPAENFRRVTMVEEINHPIAAGRVRVKFKQLPAQNRRGYKQVAPGKVLTLLASEL
jgi:hypothetical protein